MIKKIKNNHLFIKHKKYIRFLFFCLVGGTAFLLDWGLFNLFYKIGFVYTLANIFSWIITMNYSFLINRNITFSAKGSCIKKQVPKWLLVYLIAFIIRISFSNLILSFVEETTLTANLATILGILIAIPISFFGSLLWAFKEKGCKIKI